MKWPHEHWYGRMWMWKTPPSPSVLQFCRALRLGEMPAELFEALGWCIYQELGPQPREGNATSRGEHRSPFLPLILRARMPNSLHN